MIILDENVDQFIINQLNEKGYEIYSVRKNTPGISDRQIIEFAAAQNALLITEDKDFGELVFSHNIKGCSVLLLRYEKPDLSHIIESIFRVLEKASEYSENQFYTITPKKIRVRSM